MTEHKRADIIEEACRNHCKDTPGACYGLCAPEVRQIFEKEITPMMKKRAEFGRPGALYWEKLNFEEHPALGGGQVYFFDNPLKLKLFVTQIDSGRREGFEVDAIWKLP